MRCIGIAALDNATILPQLVHCYYTGFVQEQGALHRRYNYDIIRIAFAKGGGGSCVN